MLFSKISFYYFTNIFARLCAIITIVIKKIYARFNTICMRNVSNIVMLHLMIPGFKLSDKCGTDFDFLLKVVVSLRHKRSNFIKGCKTLSIYLDRFSVYELQWVWGNMQNWGVCMLTGKLSNSSNTELFLLAISLMHVELFYLISNWRSI